MTHTIHDAYRKTLVDMLTKWEKRRSRPLDPDWREAALTLLQVDLDPIGGLLDTLYSDKAHGRPPFDPIVMFRGLLLMTLLHKTSIDQFVKDLRTKPRLALIAGFQPHKTPSVGAFYLFVEWNR